MVRRSTLLFAMAALPALAASGQTPSFRAGIELVEVAVIARDSDGRMIRDLTQSDFQIIERGVPQRIVAFDRVSIPPVPASHATAAAVASSDVASNDAVEGRRVFVLVLDALHVAPAHTRAVRQRATEFIEQYVCPADLVAVLSPGGLAAATQDFTADKARLIAAVQQFAGSKVRSATVGVAEEQAALDRGGVAPHGGKDPDDQERAGRAQALANVLENLARHLARIAHRRTAILLFSEGIDYDLGDALGRVQRYTSDVVRATERAVDALMRANVSVYAIDPRGLASSTADLLETPVFNTTPSHVVGPSVEGEFADSIRALRNVSESTGGFAAVDRTDFAAAFGRIVEESSEYYILGFAPENPGRPGDFRDVMVKVGRPGVRVVARKGYVIPSKQASAAAAARQPDPIVPPPIGRSGRSNILNDSRPEPAAAPRTGVSADLAALLASPLPDVGLPIRVQAIAFRGDARKSVVELVVEVRGRSLRFLERGRRFDERVELALLTVDAGAHAANGRSATFDLHLAPEQYQGVNATGIRWVSRLEMAPGHYQVRVAGRAARTGASGLVTCDVDVPKFEPDRLAMSSVMITSLPSVLNVTQGGARLAAAVKMPPSAGRTFVAGDQITVAVEVYPPASAPSADLEAEIEDAQGQQRALIKTTVAVAPRQTRVEPVVFPIDTLLLAPGRYVLRIVSRAASGGDPVQRQVPFEIIVQ